MPAISANIMPASTLSGTAQYMTGEVSTERRLASVMKGAVMSAALWVMLFISSGQCSTRYAISFALSIVLLRYCMSAMPLTWSTILAV